MILCPYHNAANSDVTKKKNNNTKPVKYKHIINNNQHVVVQLLHNCSNYVPNSVPIYRSSSGNHHWRHN